MLRPWTEINSVALWQSVKVNRGTPGRNLRSMQMPPNHRASTPFTARYGFTSENRTISNASCFNIGSATTPVSHVPLRPLLHSKSAIWLNGCDNKRPWLPGFGRSAIKPWRRRSFQRSNRTVLSSGSPQEFSALLRSRDAHNDQFQFANGRVLISPRIGSFSVFQIVSASL